MSDQSGMGPHPRLEDQAEGQLERLFDRGFRELPLRRAPHSLESRVLGELQRRAARPWWRQSFSHWPAFARAALVAGAGGLIVLAIVGGSWTAAVLRPVDAIGALEFLPTHRALALLSVAGELSALLTRVISPLWLYAALAAATALYAVLFGLGAAAYRTLYLEPAGDP